MPFPESTQMGWGTDVSWSDFVVAGYRFGIVDAIPMEHLAPGGALYDFGPEVERTNALLAERGLAHMGQLMHTLGRHRWLPFLNVRSVAKPPLNGAH